MRLTLMTLRSLSLSLSLSSQTSPTAKSPTGSGSGGKIRSPRIYRTHHHTSSHTSPEQQVVGPAITVPDVGLKFSGTLPSFSFGATLKVNFRERERERERESDRVFIFVQPAVPHASTVVATASQNLPKYSFSFSTPKPVTSEPSQVSISLSLPPSLPPFLPPPLPPSPNSLFSLFAGEFKADVIFFSVQCSKNLHNQSFSSKSYTPSTEGSTHSAGCAEIEEY